MEGLFGEGCSGEGVERRGAGDGVMAAPETLHSAGVGCLHT